MAVLSNTLQLRQSQSQTLTMTPQLQQAIRLLQLSTLDLRQEIQQTVENNPLLEIDESIANANLESLDAIADKERQASDSEDFDPFNDDATYQGTDVQLAPSDMRDTADIIGRDSHMHEEYDIAHGGSAISGAAHGSDGDGDHNSDASYNGGSGDYADAASDAASAAGLDHGDGSAAALAMRNDGEGRDFDEYGDDFYSDDFNSDFEFSLAERIANEAAASSSNNTNKDSDMPDKLATADMDPGSSSTLENLDNLARDDNYSAKSRAKGSPVEDASVYEGETQVDLHDHLMWQLDCSPLKGRDRAIAEAIIDAIDDSGYLTEPLEDILPIVQEQYPEATIDDIAIVLKLVQHYEPLGVGARSVQECLLIQIKDKLQTDSSIEVMMAAEVIEKYLDLLSNHDYRNLCQKLGIKEDTLKLVNDVIVSLNPRPGRTAVREKADYIIPDVLVVKNADGEYDVVLNPDALPRVKLNEQYKTLVCYARNEREKEFFKSNLQEANWFIQSIAKRNDTLLKVAKCIIDHQKAFLDYGEYRMEPLVLNDIAREISMHESTISRVTTEKYLYTPRGTFELKYFFSSHVSTESGGTASSTAIRAEIKDIVSKENARRPYSDNQIANILKEKGFCVARRTIAKYRESLGIGSSSQRKRLV